MSDDDCLFCKIVAGDVPGRRRARGRARAGIPGHQRHKRRPTCWSSRVTTTRRRGARSRRPRRSPSSSRGQGDRPGRGHDDFRLVFNTGPARASPCSTSTVTCWPGATCPGRPVEQRSSAARARRRAAGPDGRRTARPSGGPPGWPPPWSGAASRCGTGSSGTTDGRRPRGHAHVADTSSGSGRSPRPSPRSSSCSAATTGCSTSTTGSASTCRAPPRRARAAQDAGAPVRSAARAGRRGVGAPGGPAP